jgi:hypothetical protein
LVQFFRKRGAGRGERFKTPFIPVFASPQIGGILREGEEMGGIYVVGTKEVLT